MSKYTSRQRSKKSLLLSISLFSVAPVSYLINPQQLKTGISRSTYSAVRLSTVASTASRPDLDPRPGLMDFSSECWERGAGVATSSTGGDVWFWKRTFVNLRLVAVYSQARFADSQRLHRGISPEHLVLC